MKWIYAIYVALRSVIVPCPEFFYHDDYTIKVNVIGKLPFQIDESSGLSRKDSLIITHNDTGGNATLYLLNDSLRLIDSIVLDNTSNSDWEALAHNTEFIFIGDIGNNNSKKSTLYILRYSLLEKRTDSIEFIFPIQSSFPPEKRRDINYNFESLYWKNDSLHFYSKNRKYNWVRHYSLPDVPGKYTATLTDSLYLNEFVTGADYLVNDNLVALVTYGKILFYTDNENLNFCSCRKIPFAGQTEAIVFIDAEHLLMTNEKGKVFLVEIIPK